MVNLPIVEFPCIFHVVFRFLWKAAWSSGALDVAVMLAASLTFFRRKLCSLFVQVCHCFLQRNDFNGLAAVYTGGLSSAPIYRLKKTTGIFTYKEDEKVPRDEFESIFEQLLAEKYEAVKLAMSTDKNFTNYRQW
jgi:hypothetical protein